MEKESRMSLSGELQGSGTPQRLRDEINRAWESAGETLIIDLSDVTKLDYDAVVAMLTIRNEKPPGTILFRYIPDGIAGIIDTFRIPV